MTTTQEEAELMFSKCIESSSKIFFAAFKADRTVVDSFYGNVVGISHDMVLVMGDGKRRKLASRMHSLHLLRSVTYRKKYAASWTLASMQAYS
jgi:hypothetical protein